MASSTSTTTKEWLQRIMNREDIHPRTSESTTNAYFNLGASRNTTACIPLSTILGPHLTTREDLPLSNKSLHIAIVSNPDAATQETLPTIVNAPLPPIAHRCPQADSTTSAPTILPTNSSSSDTNYTSTYNNLWSFKFLVQDLSSLASELGSLLGQGKIDGKPMHARTPVEHLDLLTQIHSLQQELHILLQAVETGPTRYELAGKISRDLALSAWFREMVKYVRLACQGVGEVMLSGGGKPDKLAEKIRGVWSQFKNVRRDLGCGSGADAEGNAARDNKD